VRMRSHCPSLWCR